MTVWFLMEELKKALTAEFRELRLKNEDSLETGINFFQQNLPKPDDDEEKSYFPYVVIRFEGSQDKDYQTAVADILFIIGVFDDALNYQGYRDVMNIQESIRQMLLRNRIMAGQFILDWPLRVITNDDYSDTTYPYFYGAISTKWQIPVMLMDLEAYE